SKYIKISQNSRKMFYMSSKDNLYPDIEDFLPREWLTAQEVKILSYHQFGSEWRTLLGHHKPIIQESEIIGILANFIDITHDGIIDMGRFLFDETKKIKRKKMSLVIKDMQEHHQLTKREQECLFF